ncbi:MAG: hypothetical protein LBK99_25620 [Opitutaceae bacterium]|jgi:hypothetical protein|nr:hypothetical protein [Opitutaceae bacterium]
MKHLLLPFLACTTAWATPSVTDSFLRTSWRDNYVRIDLAGAAAPGRELTVSARLVETPDAAQPVRAFTPVAVRADTTGAWKTTLRTPLEGLKPWNRQFPHLYHYIVEVSGPGSSLALVQPARRVGLREVWIEDGRFVLNGNPVTIVDDVWRLALPKDHDGIVLAMRQAKAMGFSGARLSDPAHLRAADEVGIAAIANIGSFVRLNIWDPASGLTRMDGDENREQVARRIRDLREHPSVIAWSSAAPYSLASMHPEYTGQYFNTWEYFPLNRFAGPPRQGQEIFRELVDLAATIDPTRSVASHNGPCSPIQVATLYLCDNLDLQEREEFWDVWFRSGPGRKAVWPSEVGMPFAGHQFIRYVDHQMPQGGLWPKIHTENLARLIGDEAYTIEDDANFANWLRLNFYPMMKWPATQRLTSINVAGIWRAYRTYGVNVSAHHVLNENAFGRIPEKINGQPWQGLTRHFPNAAVDEITPAARAYLDAVTPVLGYIGGPDTRFTNKDHLFFSGAPVRKAYIVVNDLDEPVAIDARWRLRDSSGAVVMEGQLRGNVPAGRRALTDFPIEFAAPAVAARATFTLEVSPSSVTPQSAKLDDTFAITIFPKHRVPGSTKKFPGAIWTLNISDDLTHESPHFFINRDNQALLRAAGIEARLVAGLNEFEYHGYSPDAAKLLLGPVSRRDLPPLPPRAPVTEGRPKPGDLLVIPRHALSTGINEREKNLRLLEQIDFDHLVEQGLRVLVLEQSLGNLLGLQTESIRPRRAFISAPGHPVFDGLQNSDLSCWTGSSDLEAAITPLSASEQRWPERVWHTSNTNAVATRTLVRPQVGAARALAVSGFDLQETPLLEVVRGKGRILFCQFDVTNRYGKDPAATRLLDNLFAYLTRVPEPRPAVGKIGTLAAGTEDVGLLHPLFRAAVPEGPDGWGITQGDLFNREAIYDRNQITPRLPDRQFPVFAKQTSARGYPSVIRRSPGGLETTLHPDLFETGWMKRKAAWVRAALLINQGGTSGEGPALRHHGRITPLYPHVWVEGFVHPYTSNIW